MTLQELRDVLKEPGIPVAHYKAQMTEHPYIVFRGLGTRYSHASGTSWREIRGVGVDHYTKTPFDETVDKLIIALLENKINFTTAEIWYEEDEVIQTSFDFSISRELEV